MWILQQVCQDWGINCCRISFFNGHALHRRITTILIVWSPYAAYRLCCVEGLNEGIVNHLTVSAFCQFILHNFESTMQKSLGVLFSSLLPILVHLRGAAPVHQGDI